MGLVWREQLSVGNNVIDTDHKHLIDIINHVEQSLGAKNRHHVIKEDLLMKPVLQKKSPLFDPL